MEGGNAAIKIVVLIRTKKRSEIFTPFNFLKSFN